MDILNPGKKNSKDQKLKAKKSLGQNFLIDDSVLEDIALAASLQKGETVIEIGPGHGELTEQLLAYSLKLAGKPLKIIVVEKDWRLAELLRNKYKDNKNLKVIEGDALEVLPELTSKLRPKSYKLLGNIPYYITGQLFRIIEGLKNKPELIVFTIQKEVAERICAQPKRMNPVRSHEGSQRDSASHGMNLLAASTQIWAMPEIIRLIGKESFRPSPKVDSAIIRLTPHGKPKRIKKYYDLLHIIFKQPRKTLLNNLKDAVKNNLLDADPEEFLEKAGIPPQIRPQDLTIEELIRLSDQL